MAAITWGLVDDIQYEAGLDHGVLYPDVGAGVPWNGLVSIDESAEETSTEAVYFNGKKLWDIVRPGEFQATLNAVTYPNEFLPFDGLGESDIIGGVLYDNQPRRLFNLSYRTKIGSVDSGLDHGYKIHLLYNLVAEPKSVDRQTVTDTVDPNVFSWSIKASPISPTNRRPTAHVILDSTSMYPSVLAAVEDILYGTESTLPRMITIEELEALYTITVVDNGDGTATITGPDEYVYISMGGDYTIDAFGIHFIEADLFSISSS